MCFQAQPFHLKYAISRAKQLPITLSAVLLAIMIPTLRRAHGRPAVAHETRIIDYLIIMEEYLREIYHEVLDFIPLNWFDKCAPPFEYDVSWI